MFVSDFYYDLLKGNQTKEIVKAMLEKSGYDVFPYGYESSFMELKKKLHQARSALQKAREALVPKEGDQGQTEGINHPAGDQLLIGGELSIRLSQDFSSNIPTDGWNNMIGVHIRSWYCDKRSFHSNEIFEQDKQGQCCAQQREWCGVEEQDDRVKQWTRDGAGHAQEEIEIGTACRTFENQALVHLFHHSAEATYRIDPHGRPQEVKDQAD